MSRTSMNISLPQALRDFVSERVKTGFYGNNSDYIRDLIKADKKKAAQEHLEALLLEGLNSGPASPMTDADYDEIRGNVRARLKANQAKA